MAFVRVVKNKAYFKRFQVKYRRRREGKTDFRARRKLTAQDKNKYNTPKYRLIVRFSNKDILCQVAYAKIQGDVILAAAYSHELPRYGVKVGLTNYAAAYATGLLVARRALQKLGLDTKYVGKEEADGEIFRVEHLTNGPHPFKCFLDVGLARTTTGSRMFAALKGASDGGLDIPHTEKRFVGYDKESKQFNPEVLRKYIFGGHVADYMRQLESEEPESYARQFAEFISLKITADDLEEMYKQCHAAIRQDPSAKPTERSEEDLNRLKTMSKKYTRTPWTLKQRQERIHQRKEAFLAKLAN